MASGSPILAVGISKEDGALLRRRGGRVHLNLQVETLPAQAANLIACLSGRGGGRHRSGPAGCSGFRVAPRPDAHRGRSRCASSLLRLRPATRKRGVMEILYRFPLLSLFNIYCLLQYFQVDEDWCLFGLLVPRGRPEVYRMRCAYHVTPKRYFPIGRGESNERFSLWILASHARGCCSG